MIIPVRNFNVDYFITKFQLIPEELWCRFKMKDRDKRCALGHCGCGVQGGGDYGDEALALMRLFDRHGFDGPQRVNDDVNNFYPHLTPKQRILAVLQMIKDKIT